MQKWDKKRGTMRHYDYQARVYDAQYLDEQNAKIEGALKNVKLGSNEFVLDVGCGTGFLFPHLYKSTEFLVGLDISQRLLREAKRRIKNLSNVLLVRADADNIPFPSHIFDGVFAITLLQNMPDPATTVLEMARVSKLEALFVVTGLKKKFTRESFVDLLNRAKLKVSSLQTNEDLKDFIAVCTKGKSTV